MSLKIFQVIWQPYGPPLVKLCPPLDQT